MDGQRPGLAPEFWDSFSDAYSSHAQGDIPDQIVEHLMSEGILEPSYSVLEVGSGKGAYSLRLAPRVRILTCMDFSARMLDHLFEDVRRLGYTNVESFHQDWGAYTPKKGYSACMTSLLPGSDSVESLERMEGSARKRCAMVLWERNERESLTRSIRDELGMEWPQGTRNSARIFDWLDSGDRIWDSKVFHASIDIELPLEYVVSKEVSRFRASGVEADVGTIATRLLEDSTDNGMVRYTAENDMRLIHWDIPGV